MFFEKFLGVKNIAEREAKVRRALGQRPFGAALLMAGAGQNKCSATSMTTPTM